MQTGTEEAPPLGVPGAALITLASVIALQLLARGAALVWAASHRAPLARAQQVVTTDPLDIALVQGAAFAIVVAVALRLLTDAPARTALALRPVAPLVAMLAIVGGAALQLPLAEIGNVVQMVAPDPPAIVERHARLLVESSPLAALATVLCVVVVAPLTEELLFRGLLLRGLVARHRPAVAVVVSAALFGASHFGALSAMVYATVAGLVLGAVALRTRSTLVPIALHAAVNAVPVLLPARTVRILGFNDLSETTHISPLLVGASGAVAALALYGISRATRREEEGE